MEAVDEASTEKVGAVPGGYSDQAWMNLYGGSPAFYQVDGYLAAIGASANQKTLVQNARAGAPTPHWMPIDKIKSILANNS